MAEAAKQALIGSPAGMRLIAQTTFFNQADFPRLRQYIDENYTATALSEIMPALRLTELKVTRRLTGKLRFEQVLGVDKYRVIAALSAELGGVYLAQLVIEEEYPHKIIGYSLLPMQEHEESSE